MTEQREDGVRRYTCGDCRNEFLQPFVCTTCGAQKLYDHTVTSQAQQIETLGAKLAEAERLNAVAVARDKYLCGLLVEWYVRVNDGEDHAAPAEHILRGLISVHDQLKAKLASTELVLQHTTEMKNTRTDAANEFLLRLESAEARIRDLQSQLAMKQHVWEQADAKVRDLEQELENERASGIHSCHNKCQRPLCVAQRQVRELEALCAERNRQNAYAFGRLDEAVGLLKAVVKLYIELGHITNDRLAEVDAFLSRATAQQPAEGERK